MTTEEQRGANAQPAPATGLSERLSNLTTTQRVLAAGSVVAIVVLLVLVVRGLVAGVEVSGSVTIHDERYAPGTTCGGAGLEEGDPVKISADGETLGLTQLDGTRSGDSCVLSFEMSGIDGGHAFYSLELGDKPPVELSRDELDEPIELTGENS